MVFLFVRVFDTEAWSQTVAQIDLEFSIPSRPGWIQICSSPPASASQEGELQVTSPHSMM